MKQKIQFEDARARSYQKHLDVLAFQSDDPIQFMKAWGIQKLRAGGWVVVPLSPDGAPTGDIYGVDEEVFADTYEPSKTRDVGRYRKTGTIRAYQPGVPFSVDTVLADGHLEVDGAQTGSEDAWIVKAPGGEVYIIENHIFQDSYEEVPE